MALTDRIPALCDLLLGAAYADHQFKDRERDEVRGILADLTGKEVTAELDARIAKFDPKKFDLAATANAFRGDSPDDRKRVLFLVAAINDADDEVDFAEDDYLRALADALDLSDDALAGLTVDVEVEDMRADFEKVRTGPPPPPPKKQKDGSVDIDL